MKLILWMCAALAAPSTAAAESRSAIIVITVPSSDAPERAERVEPVVTPPAREPTVSPLAARLTVGYGRDDGGTYSTPVTAALALRIAPWARVTGSATRMEATAPQRYNRITPLRLGLEARGDGIGLELGGFVGLQRDCMGEPTTSHGAYATARVYVPLARRAQLVVEATGYYALRQASGCELSSVHTASVGTMYFEAYGASLGAGMEVAL